MRLLKLSFVGVLVIAAALAGLLLFKSAPLARAADVVTSYSSRQVLQPGLIVSKDSSQPHAVKATPANDEGSMFGVVIDPSDAPLTLSGNGQQVFVATSGIYSVLVSAVSGPIKAGDYISLSSLNGIGAKATLLQSTIVGQAESGFDGSSNVISNNNGQAIGRIYVNLAVGKNPIESSAPLPAFLTRFAVGLADKPEPAVRIYVALIIFVVTFIAAITILWSGIRSSLVSLGRNPLSRHVILSGLYKVIFTTLCVFAIGLAGVYLLLKV